MTTAVIPGRQSGALIRADPNVPIPDILGSITKRKERFESAVVQWTATLSPPVVRSGGGTSLTVLLQNVLGGPAEATVRVSVTRHPNAFGSKVESASPTKVRLSALETGLLSLPISLKPDARRGEYRLKIDISSSGVGSSQRLRAREGSPGDGNRAKDATGVLVKNAIGIGLAATVGFGFISIPRSEIGVSFTVENSVYTQDQPAGGGLAAYETLWTGEQYAIQCEAHRRVVTTGNLLTARLSDSALVDALRAFIAGSGLAGVTDLHDGEKALLIEACATSASDLLRMEDTGTRMLERLVEDDLSSGGAGEPRAEAFIATYFSDLLSLSAASGLDVWYDAAGIASTAEGRWQVATGLAPDLIGGAVDPTFFWASWGVAGLRSLDARPITQPTTEPTGDQIEAALLERERQDAAFGKVADLLRGLRPRQLGQG